MRPSSLIDQLREALDGDQRSLRALAAEAKVDHGALSRFFRGEAGLSLATASALAEALGLSLVSTVRKRRKP